jgi:hypothetical protein
MRVSSPILGVSGEGVMVVYLAGRIKITSRRMTGRSRSLHDDRAFVAIIAVAQAI